MKILDINGKLINVDLRESNHPPRENCRSLIQKKVQLILLDLFPFDLILEEFTIPGSRLSLDFLVPKRKIAIEVQGEQHDKYNSFFHGEKTSLKFGKQIKRDVQKQEWAQMNDFSLIEIRDEKDIECLQKLKF
jgi:hypothetical protein